MIISEKIQAYRKMAGLSQEELAKSLLVSRQTISLWENGQTLPTIDNLIRLKEIFGVSLDEMLSEECTDAPNTDKELFDEIYSSEAVDISNIRRAFLCPRYAICGLLIALVSALITYTVLKNPVGFLGIFLPILIVVVLAPLTLNVASAITTYRQLRAIKCDADKIKSTVRINPEAVVIETKINEKTVSYSHCDHSAISVSKHKCGTLLLNNGNATAYLNERDISNSTYFPSFKKIILTPMHTLYITATVTLALIVAMILTLIPGSLVKRIEHISGINIPDYIGITESDDITFKNGMKADYYAEFFFDSENAEELEKIIEDGDGWTAPSHSSYEALEILDDSMYLGAEYAFTNARKDGECILMLYFEDENMLRVIIYTITN